VTTPGAARPSLSDPVLGPDELNANLADAFDQQRPYVVTSVGPGVATLELGEAGLMIRPGGTVSGPTVMALVDAAAWIVLLAHIGWEPLAVTSNLSINFLAKPDPARLVATAELLKLGRRLAVCDVRVTCGDDDVLVADASVTYAIPSSYDPASTLPTSSAP
jgi:acyl-coenzyme A thioesterase PaaI-like protein